MNMRLEFSAKSANDGAARRKRDIRLFWRALGISFALALSTPARADGEGGKPPSSDAPSLEQIEKAFQQVIEQVTPSVVGIRVQRRYMATLPGDEGAAGGLFEQLVTINGSGTVIDADGLILTNEHVVQSAGEIQVYFYDQRMYPATVVASDPRGDLAVIKIERRGLTPAKIADWSTVARGQWAITMGNPYGIGSDGRLSVSVGVISNLDRALPGLGEVDDRFYADMIQTTASIHPGCSGGPLFNIRGELTGVVTAMHTRAPADEGIGFAIPMTAGRLHGIRELAAGRSIEYGYLGLTVRSVEPEERRLMGVESPLGAVIQQIDPTGPASLAGLRTGDMIMSVESSAVQGPGSLAELVGQTVPGQTVAVEVRREGERMVIHPVVQRREISFVTWMRGGAILWRGMRLTDLTPAVRRNMGVDATVVGVVVIDVLPGSQAERAKIEIGDVVEGIGETVVGNLEDFNRAMADKKESVVVRFRSRGEAVIQP
jgi:serine protease Do